MGEEQLLKGSDTYIILCPIHESTAIYSTQGLHGVRSGQNPRIRKQAASEIDIRAAHPRLQYDAKPVPVDGGTSPVPGVAK